MLRERHGLRLHVLVLAFALALLASIGGHDVGPAAAASPRLLRDVPYIDDGTTAHRFDACLPAPHRGRRPAILLVHGGAFSAGDKGASGMRWLCGRLARAGYVAVSLNYRLLPRHPFPAALHDLRAAVRWIRSPAAARRLGVDPRRIGAFGESAGAVLVAEDGTSGHGSQTRGARLRAVVGLSTATTFELDPASIGADARRIALAYLRCRTFERCPTAHRASALAGVDRTDPAFLLAASRGDWIPVTSTTRFAAALRRAHVPVETSVVAGRAHGMQLLDAPLLRRVLRFYRRHL